MRINKTFDYNPNLGITICELQRGDNTFYGSTVCHPEDMDMISEYTGGEIADMRAELQMLQHIKNNEIKPALKTLYHLYNCIIQSSHCNPKSHELRLLKRQIKKLEADLAEIKLAIKEQKQFLNDYISQKDRIYQRIRAKKQEDKSN